MERMFIDDSRVIYAPIHHDKSIIDSPDFSNIDYKYLRIVKNFYNVLKENIPEENLYAFKDRIYTASIKSNYLANISNMLHLRNIGGEYVPETNQIILYLLDKSKCVINHELLHLASTNVDMRRGVINCGLEQENDTITLGLALNEGCTEYFNNLYFNTPKNEVCYKYQSFVIRQIEKLIGGFELQKLYFNGDLYNLILRLSNYSSINRVVTFIMKTDDILINQEHLVRPFLNTQNIYYVNFFLIEAYSNYLLELYKKNEISKVELEYYLGKFVIELKEQLDLKLLTDKNKLRKNIRETRDMFLERVRKKL